MPSHGYGPSDHGQWGNRVGTTDIEGGYRLHLPRSEFKDGDIQMGDADMIGPVDVPNHIRRGELIEGVGFDSNALQPGDVGFRSRYTLQGFPGDAESFPGDVGPLPNSSERATWPNKRLRFALSDEGAPTTVNGYGFCDQTGREET
ncbi:uncharacterized protein LOC112086467 [Eutrema salsugineum]|uniref:uncharacterized protein LOC112086467 n=1 Tax=Eutrema salsugineum TaxID=72664 RepID=UPI000CED412E|nr:uncharacterized protein LOC112086467 [Eutrema salsugineum]